MIARNGASTQGEYMSNSNFKMVDDTTLSGNLPTSHYLHQIRNNIRICEDEDIDFEPYISKDCLMIVIKQLECCLRNKDKIKK